MVKEFYIVRGEMPNDTTEFYLTKDAEFWAYFSTDGGPLHQQRISQKIACFSSAEEASHFLAEHRASRKTDIRCIIEPASREIQRLLKLQESLQSRC